MCKKNNERVLKFRTAIRSLEVGESHSIEYDPKRINLSTLRVTASSLGTDLDRKYSVSKQDKKVIITRTL